MIVEELQLAHKSQFERCRGEFFPCLSAYSFANLYAWKSLYRITCSSREGAFAVFMQDGAGMFMPLPPLGSRVTRELTEQCFGYMLSQSRYAAVVRIENIGEEEVSRFEAWGLRVREKPGDYVCERAPLALLSGTAYKHKRAAVNRFLRQYQPAVRVLMPSDAGECLALYGRWMQERAASHSDALYRGMLEDNRKTLAEVFGAFEALGISGIAVEAEGGIRAFTLGGPLSSETFCVMFEVADLQYKGIGQYIFREFASRLEGYRYLNLMDDSGLDNLSRVKESYHPAFIAKAFIATKDA